MVVIAGIVVGEKATEGCDAATDWLPESSATRTAPRITIFRFERPDESPSAKPNDSQDLMLLRIGSTF